MSETWDEGRQHTTATPFFLLSWSELPSARCRSRTPCPVGSGNGQRQAITTQKCHHDGGFQVVMHQQLQRPQHERFLLQTMPTATLHKQSILPLAKLRFAKQAVCPLGPSAQVVWEYHSNYPVPRNGLRSRAPPSRSERDVPSAKRILARPRKHRIWLTLDSNGGTKVEEKHTNSDPILDQDNGDRPIEPPGNRKRLGSLKPNESQPR
ncbi:hypothetical protein B0J18DRAFT_428813 [Chaetomium sp. MPI-SDFR-AT-0129]|nr:hypothetical protein B0J18DRAFT_428813 [Chaetomium sp. MPI-SDFR-AT-0129]